MKTNKPINSINMDKRKILKHFCLALIILTVFGCYPGDDLVVEEVDIVSTDYEPIYFDTNNPGTYHMPDTIGVIGDNESTLTREQMDFILDQVDRNFLAIGYEPLETIDPDNLPDVVVTVNAVEITSVGVGCIPWYGWWGWYPWYPGWGWGTGYCYPTYAYSYTTGTVTIDMISPGSNPQGEDTFYRVWEAGFNGLLRSSQAGNEAFISDNVDQAFAQSPYLAQ